MTALYNKPMTNSPKGTPTHLPVRADTIEPQKVTYLYEERIPRGMICFVAGKREQGKGLFGAHLSAHVSRSLYHADGTLPTGRSRRKTHLGQVLYSTMEDSQELMTAPRLRAAGANMQNVHLWRFQLPTHLNRLEEHLSKGVDLLILDPFARHLARGYSRHADSVGEVLEALTTIIERTNTAVVVIEHVLKRIPSSGDPLDAVGGGSSGLVAASRMGFILGKDPADEDRRILCCVKHNIRGPAPALAFEVDLEDVPGVNEVPLLLPQGETEFDPMRLLVKDRSSSTVGRPPDKQAAAADWLSNHLYAFGPLKAGKLFEDAKQVGMSQRTLRRAADGIECVRNPPGGGRNCTWDLPDELRAILSEADGKSKSQPSIEEELAVMLGKGPTPAADLS